MNVLIVGCKRVGGRLARVISEGGHDVSVLAESESDAAVNLDGDFSGIVTFGVGIDRDDLCRAGIESCDAVCAVTDDDNTNIMVSQLAKEIYGVKKVICRVYDTEKGNVFESFGIENVCPTLLTVEAFNAALTPEDERYENFGSHTVRFTEMDIPRELVGITAAEIEYEQGEVLFAVVKPDGQMRLVGAENVGLCEGDRLIFAKSL